MKGGGLRPTDGDDRPVVGWVLLDANRVTVTEILTITILAFLTALDALDLPFETISGAADTIETLFHTLISVLITGMTLVASINQLVLSQEFGSLGRQSERMDKSMAFRKDSGRSSGGPVRPNRTGSSGRSSTRASTGPRRSGMRSKRTPTRPPTN